jgi:hypothetical protein
VVREKERIKAVDAAAAEMEIEEEGWKRILASRDQARKSI